MSPVMERSIKINEARERFTRRNMQGNATPAQPDRRTHHLIIDSLRDLKARCSCGLWALSAPAHDTDIYEFLRGLADMQHQRHIRDTAARAPERLSGGERRKS